MQRGNRPHGFTEPGSTELGYLRRSQRLMTIPRIRGLNIQGSGRSWRKVIRSNSPPNFLSISFHLQRSMEKFLCNLGWILATHEIIERTHAEDVFRLSIYRNRSSIYTDNQCSNVQRFGWRADFSIYASPRARPKYGKMLPRVCFFSGISPTRYYIYI